MAKVVICDMCREVIEGDKKTIGLEISEVSVFFTGYKAERIIDLCGICFNKIESMFPPEPEKHAHYINCDNCE